MKSFLDGRVVLHAGDSRDVLRGLPDACIDSVVTDPPYGLEFMGKSWDSFTGAGMTKPGIGERETKWPSFIGTNKTRCRQCGMLVGQGGSACRCEAPEPYNAALPRSQGFGDWCFTWAAELYRVLKPGGHLVAFSGTRTYHRMACAIEDAGFEIRDQIGWTYGSGFPKSHNIGDGWGTALKPAWEPICLARKPLTGTVAANVLEHGTGALNIDGCRVHGDDAQGGEYTVKRLKPGATLNATGGNWRPEEGGVEYHGEMKPGRWPANIVHDGSEEVLKAFPAAPGQRGDLTGNEPTASGFNGDVYGKFTKRRSFKARRDGEASASKRYTNDGATNFAALPGMRRSDDGSAARFFYTAKADQEDRLGSKHPTVKPLDLMQWLVRLVTPKGGVVLDPFAGTGTTGEAAWREGMRAVLIEREAEYQADIARRMELADNPTKRTAVAKTKNNLDKPEDLPLFAVGGS